MVLGFFEEKEFDGYVENIISKICLNINKLSKKKFKHATGKEKSSFGHDTSHVYLGQYFNSSETFKASVIWHSYSFKDVNYSLEFHNFEVSKKYLSEYLFKCINYKREGKYSKDLLYIRYDKSFKNG